MRLLKTTPPTLTIDVPENGRDSTPTITGKTDAPVGSKIEITITDKNGNTQTITTEVKEGGTYTVDVPNALPEGEFTVMGKVTDSVGNSTTATDKGTIDTIAPGVKVEITPEGDIKVTFDPDVDPSTITPDDIKITDKDGNPVEITLTPSEDGLTWTGKVPENVEGKV
uniref:Ig-like domain-containing protein n=1 Tax=Acinetobacter sp. CFCC 10889 TaxID=1775557 RepID=UPI001D18ADDC